MGVLQGIGGRRGWRDMEGCRGLVGAWKWEGAQWLGGLKGTGGAGRGEVVGAWTWARGGARNWEGCRDSGSTAGRGHGRGHGDEGRSTRAGEGARDGEGARGAPSIPSAGSRHSLVLRMSRCDTNSDSARGRYFSTLRGTALSAGAAQPPPPPPARPRPRTTAGSSRTAPPWPRARAASREGRERGNGGEGAGPGGGGAREPGLGARERGGAPPVAGARRCGRAELRAELRSELGSARSGVSSRGCCQHHSHFGSLHPHSVFLVPAYRRVAQRWQQPLPPPLQHWARGGSVLTALQGEQPG